MNRALDPNVLESLRQLNQKGEPDVLSEVLRLFLADTPKRIDAIAEASSRGDATALQRAAHGLKGAAGTIGAVALQAACRALEDLAKGATLGAAVAELDVLRKEYARVKADIEHLL